MTKYPKIECACGRLIGSNMFRQHGRRCTAQLKVWTEENGTHLEILDDRGKPWRRSRPKTTNSDGAGGG